MSDDLIAVASYGGSGAWAAAELDAAYLSTAGIRASVGGDAHHHSPLFTGHQVVLLVALNDRREAVALLNDAAPSDPEVRRIVDTEG
jgi:hypothetical protein